MTDLKEQIKRCQALNAQGEPCQAVPMEGEGFCFFHHPHQAEERLEAQREGGRQGKLQALKDAQDLKLERVEDVTRLLSDTINHVRAGRMDPRIGNTVGYLAGVLLRSLEQGDVEKRLLALEQAILHRSQPPEVLTHEQS